MFSRYCLSFTALCLIPLLCIETANPSVVNRKNDKDGGVAKSTEDESSWEWDLKQEERRRKWEKLSQEWLLIYNRCTIYNKKWIKCYRDKTTKGCWYGWERICPSEYERMLEERELIPWLNEQPPQILLKAHYTVMSSVCHCQMTGDDRCTPEFSATKNPAIEKEKYSTPCTCFKDKHSPTYAACYPEQSFTQNRCPVENCTVDNFCTEQIIHSTNNQSTMEMLFDGPTPGNNSQRLNQLEESGESVPCMCHPETNYCVKTGKNTTENSEVPTTKPGMEMIAATLQFGSGFVDFSPAKTDIKKKPIKEDIDAFTRRQIFRN